MQMRILTYRFGADAAERMLCRACAPADADTEARRHMSLEPTHLSL